VSSNVRLDEWMLRSKLTALTKELDVTKHPGLLAEISQETEFAVRIAESEVPLNRYTCFVFAFDFVEHPDYVSIASRGGEEVYAGPEFAMWLLGKDHLDELRPQDARKGDLIFYFNNEKLVHAGRLVRPGTVISKWGTGHLYEHAVLAVPDSYGDTARYFRSLDKELALDYFVEYAKSKGMKFQET
jgi:hypothetical protein